LWKLGLDWDVEVPTDFSAQVLSWIKDLEDLKTWRIQRPYLEGPWREQVSVRLESFGDASEKAYGACVFVVTVNGNGETSSTLAISKVRVAPVKKVSLPRLELLGAVMAAQLLDFVRKALKLDKEVGRLWSDSTVALAWIKGDPTRWKPFVSNRVAQIQELSSPSQWFHCPGPENPADLLTRGMAAADLVQSSLWLHGPSFVVKEDGQVDPVEVLDQSAIELCAEEAKLSVVCATHADTKIFDVTRWGTLIKAMRVVAWVLRLFRPGENKDELTLEELEKAKQVLLRDVQRQSFPEEVESLQKGESVSRKSKIYKLSPFLGDDGLLRVRGRLDHADLSYDAKHPVILPAGHLSLLIVRYLHRVLKHGGVGVMLASLRNHY
jgi:hypothetical protein